MTCKHSNIERQLQTGPQSLSNGAGQMAISRVRLKVNQLPVSLPLQSISVPFHQQRAERRESCAVIKPAPPRMRADHQERKAQKNEHNTTHTHIDWDTASAREEGRECVKDAQREAELLLWKKKSLSKKWDLIPNLTSLNVPLQIDRKDSCSCQWRRWGTSKTSLFLSKICKLWKAWTSVKPKAQNE